MFRATSVPAWARAGLGAAFAAAGGGATSGAAAPADEIETLKQQAQQAADELEQIRRRINQLEGKAPAE